MAASFMFKFKKLVATRTDTQACLASTIVIEAIRATLKCPYPSFDSGSYLIKICTELTVFTNKLKGCT
jgi:hypothetical protein